MNMLVGAAVDNSFIVIAPCREGVNALIASFTKFFVA